MSNVLHTVHRREICITGMGADVMPQPEVTSVPSTSSREIDAIIRDLSLSLRLYLPPAVHLNRTNRCASILVNILLDVSVILPSQKGFQFVCQYVFCAEKKMYSPAADVTG